ncbi:hypothetical protein M409DRAFT_70700 [Zasmidium cellare ATCC 36951]|uniref:Cobalamin-independent methionine synthase MetE C-terminal/archaeal domain-containing protein n=1 Tax=Zasmidium cellare ATCC 36951 TaxID=1080233 RepID=A0A6A6C105_ZASCE|nr:uncharacterized protein M409DRAFT_70700 [Zasmidium cellare ATCC 36951]KAF2159948.1 hypothetical protein M409DRAFT_70700 [Zasmidium cellare ATCC 36951]
MSKATPVHFVGSIPLPDSATTFEHISSALPNPGQVKRIPDGEPGQRDYFVRWQKSVFQDAGVGHVLMQAFQPDGWKSHSQQEVQETMQRMPKLETKYDVEAIKSYKTFCEVREKGRISRGVKFQVSIPTPDNFIGTNIQPDFQAPIAPLYQDALIRAIRNTQAHIPHEDLAIQLDVALEIALLHGTWYDEFQGPVSYLPIKARKDVLMPIIVEKIVSLANAVAGDVELGFHFCYGDLFNKHFLQPPSTALIAELAANILSRLHRPVAWIHFPVPKDRTDEAYLLPLKTTLLPKLDAETEVYVGLIHAYDFEGTRRRLEVARRVLGGGIGVSTECGLGRKDGAWLGSVLEIANAVQ